MSLPMSLVLHRLSKISYTFCTQYWSLQTMCNEEQRAVARQGYISGRQAQYNLSLQNLRQQKVQLFPFTAWR